MADVVLQGAALRINYKDCPADLEDSFRLYFERGIAPGSFLTAVLENNLVRAFGRADQENTNRMHAIVAFLYNDVPSPCWGSAEKVRDWLEGFKPAKAVEVTPDGA